MTAISKIEARIRYLEESREAGKNIPMSTIKELKRIVNGEEYAPDEILGEDETYRGSVTLWEV